MPPSVSLASSLNIRLRMLFGVSLIRLSTSLTGDVVHPDHINRPHLGWGHTFVSWAITQSKVERGVRRICEVEQSGGDSIMLHECQPADLVLELRAVLGADM